MISVIVPVYKAEPYLRQCVDSILEQTYRDIEVILIDDGSPDKCGEICDEYAEKDNRVRTFHTENRGVSAARNLGISEAKGEYIGFVDSDDRIEPDMYEILLKRMQETGADIAQCGVLQYPGYGSEKSEPEDEVLLRDDALKALIEFRLNSYAWNKLYNSRLFETVTFPDGMNYEDAEIPLDTSDNDCLLIIEQTDIGSCQEHKKQNRCCNEVPDPCFRCIHPPSQPAKPNQQDEEQQHEYKWIKFESGRSAELLPEERIAKRPHHSYSLLNRRLPRVQQLLYRCWENPRDIALADQEEKCSCTCCDKEQKSGCHSTCLHAKPSITESFVFDDPLCKQKQRNDQRHQSAHIGLQKYQRKKTCRQNNRLLLPAFLFPVHPPACKSARPGCRRKICVQCFIRIQVKRIKRHKQNHTV